jgi:hypothetical protein
VRVAEGRTVVRPDDPPLEVDEALGPALEAALEERGGERLAVVCADGGVAEEDLDEIDRIVRAAGWSRIERTVSRDEPPGRESR